MQGWIVVMGLSRMADSRYISCCGTFGREGVVGLWCMAWVENLYNAGDAVFSRNHRYLIPLLIIVFQWQIQLLTPM